MSFTIQQLEDLIKAAPDKNLPVNIWCNDANLRASVMEIKLSEHELILHEADDEISDFDIGITDDEDED